MSIIVKDVVVPDGRRVLVPALDVRAAAHAPYGYPRFDGHATRNRRHMTWKVVPNINASNDRSRECPKS